jgi:hypothetical protein
VLYHGVMRWTLPSVLGNAIVVLFLGGLAAAALRNTDPGSVCDYLNEMGLATDAWGKLDSDWGCISPYKELGGGRFQDDLSYRVHGDSAVVTRLELLLNVFNRDHAQVAQGELLKAADVLATKALVAPLPNSIRKAIETGTASSAKVVRALVRVEKSEFPSGRGYELRFIIE